MSTSKALPACVETFIERTGVREHPNVRGTLIHQRGEIRMKEEGAWLPFSAEQRIEARRPEFTWHARVKMAPLVTAVVEDAYEKGHGRLDAKIWGVVPVAHGRGVDIDRGELQRYLAELPWCPFAFLENSALRFEAVGDSAARVFAGSPEVWVELRFDDAGDLVEVYTDARCREDAEQPWRGRFYDYVTIAGLRIPKRGEVAWLPPGEPFVYWRGEITDLTLSTTSLSPRSGTARRG